MELEIIKEVEEQIELVEHEVDLVKEDIPNDKGQGSSWH